MKTGRRSEDVKQIGPRLWQLIIRRDISVAEVPLEKQGIVAPHQGYPAQNSNSGKRSLY